jgi:hypothetical protein
MIAILQKVKSLSIKKVTFCICFFSLTTIYSQPIDFNKCNNSNSLEIRQQCLESQFELFFNYLTIRNTEKTNLKVGKEELVYFEIGVDSLGAFHLKNSYSLNERFEDMVSFMLKEIEPIGKFRVDNKAIEMVFVFKNLYILDNYNQVSYKKFNEPDYNLIPTPFFLADIPPEHKDCANGDKEYKIRCINLAIRSLLFNQFDTAVFSEAEVNPGYQEIIYTFIIDANGDITNIKTEASHPLIEEEIIRVISLLPAFKPATKDNNPIAVSFRQKVSYEVTRKMIRKKRRN